MKAVTRRVDRLPGTEADRVQHQNLITFYKEAPQDELSLDEFELFALDRLQLLRGIEQCHVRKLDGKELKEKMQELETKYMPLRSNQSANCVGGINADQRKDIASHFILRLAYCRNEDLKRWFLNQEQALFRFRFDLLGPVERRHFMERNGFSYDVVYEDEKFRLRGELEGLLGRGQLFAETQYYKVPFVDALSLVAERSVYLEKGFAYVPLSDLLQVIILQFRLHLSKSLAEAAQRFEHIAADTRIGPLLKNMNKQYIGKDFSKSTGAIDKLTPDRVDSAADNNMPLCMKNLHRNLKTDHKLKHWGRLQYGLFLKAAGLELEDALSFWESHFNRMMTHDQFVKGYGYMFRHMYGKEGARKNYTPYSCFKIIMGPSPEPGAHHGCPYRHASDGALAGMLNSMRIGPKEVKDIVDTAKSGNYQVACLKHFEVTHPDHNKMPEFRVDGIADHPNQWFRASITYHKLKQQSQTPALATSTVDSSATPLDSVKSERPGNSSATEELTSMEVA